MAIHHELSSDIAVALLTGKKREPEELNDLKEIIFKVHHTLQRLKGDSRRREVHVDRGRKNAKAD